jgi:ABC-type bacteriocin/lantibiotic exporter with double-glycine peptidase domain
MTVVTHNHRAVNVSVHGLFLLVGMLGLLGACGPKTLDAIRPGLASRGHYVDGVPFFRQIEYACGPSALASVLAYHQRPADLAELTGLLVHPALHGTLPMDVERVAKDRGFRTTTAHGDKELLRSSLKKDLPVICLLDLGLGVFKQPHYVVLTGFDDGNQLFIMHDGATQDRTMPYGEFEKYWARGGKWMLVMEP